MKSIAAGLALALCCAIAFAAPVAQSPDGRWRVEGQGAAVAVFDQGRLVKTLPARSLGGREGSRVSDLRYLPQRRSFAIAFETLPELWELSVDPDAPPLFDGLVHDYRMGEAIATPGFLGVRRTPLAEPVRELAADPRGGAWLRARTGSAWLTINLDVRRETAREPLAPAPRRDQGD